MMHMQNVMTLMVVTPALVLVAMKEMDSIVQV